MSGGVVDGAAHDNSPTWEFSSDRAEDALDSRDAFVAALHLYVDNFVAKVLFTELVANVVRHAPGPIHIALNLSGNAHWLHVSDCGLPFEWNSTLPDDTFLDRGRGMFLISHYSQEVVIERRPAGGNVVRIRLQTLRAV